VIECKIRVNIHVGNVAMPIYKIVELPAIPDSGHVICFESPAEDFYVVRQVMFLVDDPMPIVILEYSYFSEDEGPIASDLWFVKRGFKIVVAPKRNVTPQP